MSLITAISTLATLLWFYILVLTVVWFRAVGALDRRDHVGQFVGLMGVFVPGIALTVSTLLVGAMLGVPYVVIAIALLLPGAVVTGLQLEVSRLTGSDMVQDAQRLALAVLMSVLYMSIA
ncbi:MAG: hypothetical protein AAFR47_12660 [Pseudomonadota bacterium]